jgi:tetratricopeptide (TPR) repeat protein
MPLLNKALLLRLVVAVILLGGGLFVLHRVQSGRVPDALLWQANAAAEKGKTDKAIFYMRQYLEFRPDDHDTAIKLADLMVEKAASQKDLTNAHFLYERVLREAPGRSDVGRKLVGLCLRMNRHADAIVHAERLLKESPNDGMLWGQVAESLWARNSPDDARQSFAKAVTLNPTNVRAFDLYARLLVRHFRDAPAARTVLDAMVRANPADAEAFLVRGRFLFTQDKPDDCMRDLDRVLLLDPENAEALVLSAEGFQARGELRRAKEALRDVVAMYPRYAHGYRALSWLELLTGNQADALATLEHAITILPDAPDLLMPLADLWVERGELDRVQGVLQKLEARKDSAARVSYLRGRLLMKQGKWNEALAVLDALRTDAVALPGLLPQLNLLIAGCHERRVDRAAQVEALKRVLAADPQHLPARVALGNAHLTAGRLEDALREYQLASRSPYAGAGVVATYASLRISWGKLSGARVDEWKAISTLLAKAKEQYPHAIDPVTLSAELAAVRGDFAGAVQVLRAEAARRPDDPRLWAALAAMLSRGRGTLAAAEALSEGQLAAGDSVELRVARARVWADDLQPGREQRIARLEELPPSAGDAERNRLAGGLADVYALLGDDAGQKRMLTDLADRNASDLAARKGLYALALKENDAAAQSRWRDEIRRIEGQGGRSVALLDALAAAHSAGTTRRDDVELVRTALAETPDNPDAHLLAARLAEQAGDAATATQRYEAAADLDVTAVKYQQARLGYYLRAGRDEDARRTVARLEADPRLNLLRFRAIVEGAIVAGGPEALSKCLTWLQPQLKREPRSATWAGRLLEIRGKVTDALALYRQATESQPAFADGWSARVLASAKLGEAEVNETMTLAAMAVDRKALFAVCAESGSAVRARLPAWSPPVKTAQDRRAYAEACIAACEARGRLADAVPVLTSIADDKDARPEDAAWAKRTVAALTAALGTPGQRREAVAALREGGEKPASLDDARSRVSALTVAFKTTGGDDRRVVVREMIALLAGIVRDPGATSNDWFQLAQLYRVAGDRASCRKCLQELLKREPNNFFYVAVAVDDLLSESQLDKAEPLAKRLAEHATDIRGTASAARFYTLANEPRAVLDLMDQFVRVADAGTADGVVRQRQSAELLDQLTRLAAARGLSGYKVLLPAACERYRASLRAYPESVTPMAALLAYDGQVEPAFAELEKQKLRLSPTALATAGVAVLRSGHASSRQFQTVKAWIDEALVASPNSLPLKLNLGELHALRQDFATAEQVYRDVLNTEPKNLVALNNLAWILAPRPESADQALKFAERAIELSGATGELLDTRARILISAGRYDRAVADLNDAINQAQTPLRYFHLAVAQLKMSKADEAVKTFREARARGLDPKVIHPSDLPTFKVLAMQAERSVQ